MHTILYDGDHSLSRKDVDAINDALGSIMNYNFNMHSGLNECLEKMSAIEKEQLIIHTKLQTIIELVKVHVNDN